MAKQRKQTEKPAVSTGNLDVHIQKWQQAEALKREAETRKSRDKGTRRQLPRPVED